MLAAGSGASLRELMDRMGHASARAALLYLHGSDEPATGHRRRAEQEGGGRTGTGTAQANAHVTAGTPGGSWRPARARNRPLTWDFR